jgi:uncharacterized OB-fold protein
MKHPTPTPGGIAAPFFSEAAAASGELLLPCCGQCAAYAWPPRWRCTCGGELQWKPAPGRGRVVTWSVVRRAVVPALQDAVPYVVGFVALDAGPTLMTNIVGVAPEDLRAGLRVRCRFDVAEGAAIPVFEPEPANPDDRPRAA